MTRTFIETPLFTRKWLELGLGDDALAKLEKDILADPGIGDLISGTGGIRKIRIPLSGRGKRGGARVCYVDCILAETVYLITVYEKSKQSDLTPAEKARLKTLVKELIKP